MSPDMQYKSLYTIGGAAALVAGLVFRRNLSMEVSLHSSEHILIGQQLLRTGQSATQVKKEAVHG